MKLTPENQLDPKSAASMDLIALQRQLRAAEGKAAGCWKARNRSYYDQRARTLRGQIAAHKARCGIA